MGSVRSWHLERTHVSVHGGTDDLAVCSGCCTNHTGRLVVALLLLASPRPSPWLQVGGPWRRHLKGNEGGSGGESGRKWGRSPARSESTSILWTSEDEGEAPRFKGQGLAIHFPVRLTRPRPAAFRINMGITITHQDPASGLGFYLAVNGEVFNRNDG